MDLVADVKKQKTTENGTVLFHCLYVTLVFIIVMSFRILQFIINDKNNLKLTEQEHYIIQEYCN